MHNHPAEGDPEQGQVKFFYLLSFIGFLSLNVRKKRRKRSKKRSPVVMQDELETVSIQKCFSGTQHIYRHVSTETRCKMQFGLFLPPEVTGARVPALYWLSGLTCTEENFVVKAGAQRVAAELGIAIVVPDTSPRGLGYPGENDAHDFGSGAGFYVDATEAPWRDGYRMYSYVTQELPALIYRHFPVDPERMSIFGHSMGGHGALIIALKNPRTYKSVSAFSPIVSLMRCPWGEKALSGYLGSDREFWRRYDATALIEDIGWRGPPILVDQGTMDPFLERELKPQLLQAACSGRRIPLDLRMRNGYDHSYYFIASFIEDHLRYHASYL